MYASLLWDVVNIAVLDSNIAIIECRRGCCSNSNIAIMGCCKRWCSRQ